MSARQRLASVRWRTDGPRGPREIAHILRHALPARSSRPTRPTRRQRARVRCRAGSGGRPGCVRRRAGFAGGLPGGPTTRHRVPRMPVQEAADAMAIAPDQVYVIAPGSELTVTAGRLHTSPSRSPRGLRLPIDVLFGSLAKDQGERAIGVLLSGMGADGSVGLRSIKTHGGLTLAQSPESAQFDSMPENAIASGCVDIVATPAEMPARLLQVTRAQAAQPAQAEPPGPEQATPLDRILALLRERSKHDLSPYKSSTLLRRIDRRVAVHNLGSMAAYADFLTHNPQELDILFAEMLIGVTSFFRDPMLWADLQSKVLPDLISRRGPNAQLRAWVVGCSTGEEAYSLAMAFQEARDALPDAGACSLQIFATDLNAEAIAIARKGVYAAKAVEHLSPAL